MRLKTIILITILGALFVSTPKVFASVLTQQLDNSIRISGQTGYGYIGQGTGQTASTTLPYSIKFWLDNASSSPITLPYPYGGASGGTNYPNYDNQIGCSPVGSIVSTSTIPANSVNFEIVVSNLQGSCSGYFMSSAWNWYWSVNSFNNLPTDIYIKGTSTDRMSFAYILDNGIQIPNNPEPDTSSRIISVNPPDTASSTSASPLPYTFSLNTYLNSDDFIAGTTTISYSLINRDQGNILTDSFIATTSGNATYSSSVNTGIPNGFYQGTWSMQLPFSCGNGLDGGCYSPLLSTSTSFVLGYSAIRTINQDYLNATTTERDCSQFTSVTDPNYYICPLITSFLAGMRWLFLPDTASIESVFGLFDTLKAKAPLGYFFILKDSIGGLATSTPVVTFTAPTEIRDNIFTPIRTALAWLLWLFFGFNFYKILKITRII